MAASRQQDRPFRRAFCLLCTALTCLLLLISTLPAPAAAGAASKVLRHGVQKAAGTPSNVSDIECRKRTAAAKAVSVDDAGFACLPMGAGVFPASVLAGSVMVLPFRPGKGWLETRGARAPPLNFA